MSILGTRVIRTEDPRLLTAGGVYVDDLRTPELNGAARVTFVRSPLAHARITGIDASAALAEPGVIAVLTVADETLLFPAAGTNVAIANPVPTDDAPFDACEVVVEQGIVNQRVACLPMEGRASAVCYENGKLTVWASSQNAQVSRFILAGAL